MVTDDRGLCSNPGRDSRPPDLSLDSSSRRQRKGGLRRIKDESEGSRPDGDSPSKENGTVSVFLLSLQLLFVSCFKRSE